MSVAQRYVTMTRTVWALPFASAALGALLLLPAGHTAYLVGLTIGATLAAALIAADDYRTGLLRNRWTIPFALAGLIQVLIAAVGTQPWTRIAATCLLGAMITTSLYLLLGLLGWVGFGDVKFAAGLALIVAIPAEWAGLYLLPLALAFSAVSHLAHRLAAQQQRLRRAHGPALATALAFLMTTGCLLHT